MQSVSPACDNCGAPLKLSATARQVICGACGTRLVVHREGERVFTSVYVGYPDSDAAHNNFAPVPRATDNGSHQPPSAAPPTPVPEQLPPSTTRPGSPVPIARRAAPRVTQRPGPPTTPAEPLAPRPSSPRPQSAIEPHAEVQPVVTEAALPAALQPYRRYIPLAGGLAGIALAALGEAQVESGDTGQLSLVLYLIGIALFAASAWYMRPIPNDLPQPAPQTSAAPSGRRRSWLILGGGTALAVVLNLVAASMIKDQLDSIPGIYLWLASVLVMAATGLFAGKLLSWSPRWRGGMLPQSRNGRLLLLLAIVLILVVASAARLIALDKVPFGINADEGDRASTSIQIVRGQDTASIFDSGWYFISNLYFWLLAQLMKVIGIGYVQARVFGALASIISVATITWIGIRHFSVRVGLMAGALLSVLALSLQFARETSEAGPTATLWALSFALMLEGARTGRSWAWIGSGLAGGFSLYFYPSARLWAVVAVGYSAYLLIHSLGGRRLQILRGAVLAGVAAFVIASPFLVHTLPFFAPPGGLDIFTQRAQETSVFTGDNPTRLSYYDPNWNVVQLLAAQVDRSVGMFNQYHDDGGFWPTDRPVMWGLLTILTLLGVGWVSTRWRDPRYVLLALWFWTGLAGVIVTVETPNVQRFAAAVPMVALLPALVLDSLALRAEAFFANRSWAARLRVSWVAGGVVTVVALFLAWTQFDFYFNVYGHTDRWPQPTIQGSSVNDQGTDTLVVSLAREFHQVNSGWVRLLAPYTPRGGDRNPGIDLPVDLPADKNLSFMLYPNQTPYIPYLSALYPGGAAIPYTHPTEGLVVTMYRIPQADWAATQGAIAYTGQNNSAKVEGLGVLPPGVTTFPADIRWTAGLRVSRYWNYEFKVPTGPAKLTIDGVQVLDVQDSAGGHTTVSLAAGLHYVEYEVTVTGAGQSPNLLWGAQPQAPADGGNPPDPVWAAAKPEELYANMTKPEGLLGVLQTTDPNSPRPPEDRLDGALAFCCPTSELPEGAKPFTATWTGTLAAPATGTYSMTLFTQAPVDLKIDGQAVMHYEGTSDTTLEASPSLTAGPHAVEVDLNAKDGPGGLEWMWTPPGGERSIVPPSALSPPAHGGVGPEVAQAVLGFLNLKLSTSQPLETIP